MPSIILPSVLSRKPAPGSVPDFNHPLMSGLVGWWPLIEGGGNRVSDYSKYGAHATIHMNNLTTSSVWAPGNPRFGGMGLNLDGLNDYVAPPGTSINRPTSEVTLSLWVKFDVIDLAILLINRSGGAEISGPTIFLFGNQFQFWVSTSGAWDTQLNSDANAVTGVWYHVVGTWKSGESRMYVNGVQQVDTEADTGTINYILGRDWRIGADDNSNRLNGQMDDVRIYNRALSHAEVLQIYTNPWQPFRARRYWAVTAEEAPPPPPAFKPPTMLTLGIG